MVEHSRDAHQQPVPSSASTPGAEPSFLSDTPSSAPSEMAPDVSPEPDTGSRWLVPLSYLASMFCPGVVWASKGYVARSAWVNLGFVACWMLYAVAWLVWKFYPVMPTLWFVAVWILILGLNAHDATHAPVKRSISPSKITTILLSIMTWFGLLLVFAGFFFGNIASAVSVQSASMFPTTLPGDLVWVDRSIYRFEWPHPGDVVLYETPDEKGVRMGRVIGFPGDMISFDHGQLMDSRFPVTEGEVDGAFAEEFQRVTGFDPAYVGARFEALGGTVYPISGTGENTNAHKFDGREWRVGERQIFVLNDNRGHVDDSRVFGPIDYRQLIGMPLYVLHNASSDKNLRDVRSGTVLQRPRTTFAFSEKTSSDHHDMPSPNKGNTSGE